jgi:antitoxin ParD1/3/4
MSTMNVSLPDEMKAFVDSCLEREGYSSASEYVRALIRRDREAKASAHLHSLLVEGLASGTPIEVDAAYWQQKRAKWA